MQHGRGGLTKCIYRALGEGPRPGGTEQGGAHLPLAESGALKQSLRAAYPRKRGSCYSRLFAPPELKEVLSKDRPGSQKPRSCQHPHP